MNDEGHAMTEKMLRELEKKISAIFSAAEQEISVAIDDYFHKLAIRDMEMQQLLKAGEINKEQYQQWRLAQIGRGKRYEALRDRLAERMTAANQVAVAYVNDATPGIYSLNRNWTNYEIERLAGSNADFTIWNEDAVRRLIVEQPELMPYYPPQKALKRGIDLAYGKERIGAAVTSGILQGHSVRVIANNLQTSLVDMNRASAIRTARTAVTAAQNGGRQDAYEYAARLGIKVKKKWMSTLDLRTRYEHAAADGQTVMYDEPFTVGGEKMMFPGDVTSSGRNRYNCRCTTVTVALEDAPSKRRARDFMTGENEVIEGQTFSEWYEAKTGESFEDYQAISGSKEVTRHRR